MDQNELHRTGQFESTYSWDAYVVALDMKSVLIRAGSFTSAPASTAVGVEREALGADGGSDGARLAVQFSVKAQVLIRCCSVSPYHSRFEPLMGH